MTRNARIGPQSVARPIEVPAVPSDRLQNDAVYLGVICHTCRGSVALLRDNAEGSSQIFFGDAPLRLLVMCPSCGVASEYATGELIAVHVSRAAAAIPPR
jgi:hypothetical protein